MNNELWGVWDVECGHWYGVMSGYPRAAFAYAMPKADVEAAFKLPDHIVAPFPMTDREWDDGPNVDPKTMAELRRKCREAFDAAAGALGKEAGNGK